MDDPSSYRRMQVKVLYSFNNSSTVFLSRSKVHYSVKVAQIPLSGTKSGQEETITLGAFELKACMQQIMKSSPENFKLESEDYTVYYKDVTEMPDEPFVSSGVLSNLLGSNKTSLVPGRVCQNLSANYLFGDQGNSPTLTLEIRVKLHTIEQAPLSTQDSARQSEAKRVNEMPENTRKKPRTDLSSADLAKATRTKSLPIFYHPPNQQIFNIMNADKANIPPKYDNKSVQDRFKLAPFLQAKIIDTPSANKKKRIKNSKGQSLEVQRAMRTRSLMTNRVPVMVSSPIHEETTSDNSDVEYNENNADADEQQSDDQSVDEIPENETFSKLQNHKRNPRLMSSDQLQALPDLEDLDSKKTHTISHNKLPQNHGLVCINNNCATTSSITWRYFETGLHPNYLAIHRATEFNKRNYEGMFGPLCNACYLFLRNKGFMRPEGVVKKYLQQQKYKESKQKEDNERTPWLPNPGSRNLGYFGAGDLGTENSQIRQSSPSNSQKFLTPSHASPFANQVNHSDYPTNSNFSAVSNFHEFNDFMSELNAFGGPLTDIDPLPQDIQLKGKTPPMMATKSNTRVINLNDEEDKENVSPSNSETYLEQNSARPARGKFLHDSEPFNAKAHMNKWNVIREENENSDWMQLFGEPTPKDQTPSDYNALSKETDEQSFGGTDNFKTDNENSINNNFGSDISCLTHGKNMPPLKTFKSQQDSKFGTHERRSSVQNMPSSPFVSSERDHRMNNIDDLFSAEVNSDKDNDYRSQHAANDINTQGAPSSPDLAPGRKLDTTMSWPTQRKTTILYTNEASTPNTDFSSHDDVEKSAQSKFLETVDVSSVFNESRHKDN